MSSGVGGLIHIFIARYKEATALYLFLTSQFESPIDYGALAADVINILG